MRAISYGTPALRQIAARSSRDEASPHVEDSYKPENLFSHPAISLLESGHRDFAGAANNNSKRREKNRKKTPEEVLNMLRKILVSAVLIAGSATANADYIRLSEGFDNVPGSGTLVTDTVSMPM